MGQRYKDYEVIVDTAKIGCCYGQPSPDKTKWVTRRLKFDHNHGEKQNGEEVAHNHDCVKIKNIPRFNGCYAPYYLETLTNLKALYPKDEDYVKGYKVAYNNKLADGGSGGAQTPPCVLALLDTWFEYSDVAISNEYKELKKIRTSFSGTLDQEEGKLRNWAEGKIRELKEQLKPFLKVANPSNATKKQDEMTDVQKKCEEANRILHDAQEKIKELKNEKGDLIKEVEAYWEKIWIFKEGYQDELSKLGDAVQEYIDKWKAVMEMASLDLTNENYTSFEKHFSGIAENAKSLSESMRDWETEKEYELLFSSFLVCRCGGKIEFASSGQEHALYCMKLYNKLIVLLKNSANYLQDLLVQKCVYQVTPEESNFSVETAAKSLLNIAYAFENNSEFVLDSGTKAMEFRFITHGYNKERDKKISALIGMLVLTPISLAAAAASPAAGVAVSAILWGADAYGIVSQDREEQEENEVGDTITVVNDTADVGASWASLSIDGEWRPNKTLKQISALGKATLVVGFLNTLSGVFYTSDDDWIEEIEITVFTPYMAHIIKQGYNKMVDENPPFKGVEVVRAKSKVEYSCESLKTINWDELGGVTVEVSKDHKFGGESKEPEKMTNPDEFKEEISNNTNGELKK